MSKYVLVTVAVEIEDHADIVDILTGNGIEIEHEDVLDTQLHEVYSSAGDKLF